MKTTTEKNNEMRRFLLDRGFEVEDAGDGSERSVLRRDFGGPGIGADGAIVEVTFRGDAQIDAEALADEEVEIAVVFGGGFGHPENVERIVGVPITVGDFKSRVDEMTRDFLERERLVEYLADPPTVRGENEARKKLREVSDRIRRFLHDEKNTAATRLREMGFEVIDTGGGCRAFSAVHRGRRIQLLIGTASNDLRLRDGDFAEGLVGGELLDLDTGNPFVIRDVLRTEADLFEWIDEVQKFTGWNIRQENEKDIRDRIRDASSCEELADVVREFCRVDYPRFAEMDFDEAHSEASGLVDVFCLASNRCDELDPEIEE